VGFDGERTPDHGHRPGPLPLAPAPGPCPWPLARTPDHGPRTTGSPVRAAFVPQFAVCLAHRRILRTQSGGIARFTVRKMRHRAELVLGPLHHAMFNSPCLMGGNTSALHRSPPRPARLAVGACGLTGARASHPRGGLLPLARCATQRRPPLLACRMEPPLLPLWGRGPGARYHRGQDTRQR